jgi:hypothetical protein
MTPSENRRDRSPRQRTAAVYRPAVTWSEMLSRFRTAGAAIVRSEAEMRDSVQSPASGVRSWSSNLPLPTRNVDLKPRRNVPVSRRASLVKRLPRTTIVRVVGGMGVAVGAGVA